MKLIAKATQNHRKFEKLENPEKQPKTSAFIEFWSPKINFRSADAANHINRSGFASPSAFLICFVSRKQCVFLRYIAVYPRGQNRWSGGRAAPKEVTSFQSRRLRARRRWRNGMKANYVFEAMIRFLILIFELEHCVKSASHPFRPESSAGCSIYEQSGAKHSL